MSPNAVSSPLWQRVESRSRPGKHYYAKSDGSSQWPPARELVAETSQVSGRIGTVPREVLSKIVLGKWCDPSSAARFAASSRGGFVAASLPEAWARRLRGPPRPGSDPLKAFADPAKRRDDAASLRCDRAGRALYRARRAAELDGALAAAKEAPAGVRRACIEKLARDACVRELVFGGLLSLGDLAAVAGRYADRCALGAEAKALSPRSAGRFTSVARHVLLSDDFAEAKLADRSPHFAPFRRRETLAALDALGPAPIKLTMAHLEATGADCDALAFAVYHAEALRAMCDKLRGVRDADAIVRGCLGLSRALRGRVGIGRLSLMEAVRMTPEAVRDLEQALQRKRKQYALADMRRVRPALRGGLVGAF